VLVLRGSFGRVEHVLLALSAIFVAYVISGLLAHPDWGATARGLVVPGLPFTRAAVLATVATVGTTLAPWGLAFIQSYAVDKRLKVEDLRYERVDVVSGAVLTGVIGVFVVIACAATLHVYGRDPFLRALARDPAVMGEHRLGRGSSLATAAVIVLVAVCVLALLVLTVT